MTGFGVGEAPVSEGRVVAEVRTVNARSLDVRVRLGRELGEAALGVEQQVRARLGRGRCEVSVRLEASGQAPVGLDLGRARAAIEALKQLRELCPPGTELPLGLLAAMPDVFTPAAGEVEARRQATTVAVGRALDALEAERAREGAGLRSELAARLGQVVRLVDTIEERRPHAAAAQRKKLGERVRAVLADGALEGAVVASGRLEQEIVAFAERSDITEELARLRLHLGRLGELLDARASVGRELDFLLQEAMREVNTVGAKAHDAELSQAVVGAKAELERWREQVQNVE